MELSREDSFILKSVAMISVLLAHTSCFFSWGTDFHYIIQAYCDVGMGIFMFLSGYGLIKSYNANGFNHFWDKKIVNIYIPAVLINMVSAIIVFCLMRDLSREMVLEGIFMITRVNKVNGPTWYISFIFIYYLIFFLIYSLPRIESNTRLTLVLLVSCVMWYIMPSAYPAAYVYSFSFWTGLISGEKRLAAICRHYQVFIGGCAFLSLAILYRSNMTINFRMLGVIENILVILCTLGLAQMVSSFNKTGWLCKTMKHLGELSFWVYLMHYSFLYIPLQCGIGRLWICVSMMIMLGVAQLVHKYSFLSVSLLEK